MSTLYFFLIVNRVYSTYLARKGTGSDDGYNSERNDNNEINENNDLNVLIIQYPESSIKNRSLSDTNGINEIDVLSTSIKYRRTVIKFSVSQCSPSSFLRRVWAILIGAALFHRPRFPCSLNLLYNRVRILFVCYLIDCNPPYQTSYQNRAGNSQTNSGC
jgi:hypothetical protein